MGTTRTCLPQLTLRPSNSSCSTVSQSVWLLTTSWVPSCAVVVLPVVRLWSPVRSVDSAPRYSWSQSQGHVRYRDWHWCQQEGYARLCQDLGAPDEDHNITPHVISNIQHQDAAEAVTAPQ